jgi:hypothetical protein
MFDGIHLIERINTRGALIKVLDKPHLDLTTPLGRGFIAFLSAMAEDERPSGNVSTCLRKGVCDWRHNRGQVALALR